MIIRVATLCDAGSARAGLLSVLSAGLTQVTPKQSGPTPCPLSLAILLEFDPEELEGGSQHQLTVEAMLPEGVKANFLQVVSWEVDAEQPEQDLPVHLPVVLPLHALTLEQEGVYQTLISVDGDTVSTLPFRVNQPLSRPSES